jgi:hypothetical protein
MKGMKMKISNIVIALSLISAPLPTLATDWSPYSGLDAIALASEDNPEIFPSRDVNADCYNVVSGNHNSDAARSSINYCVDIVQLAYDSARTLWDIVSMEDRSYCLNDSRDTLNYGFYLRLNECLQVQAKLADMKSKHRFNVR